jgi:sodium-independent sulfate anion transporter 11
LNGYVINPNQELIAIGVTNTVGSCFGAYPATGSFSRSALKSQSGVRTPAAGFLTAVVVIVALYGLTEAFFWIPSAGISAIIIHAVGDLIASPAQVTNPIICHDPLTIVRIPGLHFLACSSS